MTATVRVELGTRSYDVRIGQGLIAEAGAHLAPLLARRRVAVLTDETVAARHLAAFVEEMKASGFVAEAIARAQQEASVAPPAN